MNRYEIEVFYSREDGGYIANVPDLKYCSAFGKTRQEAIRQIQIAQKAWLEAARANRKPIPAPKYHVPKTPKVRSVQKTVHVVPAGVAWAVKRAGRMRAASVHQTQRDAIEAAKQIAKHRRTDVVVHDKGGRIKGRIKVPHSS